VPLVSARLVGAEAAWPWCRFHAEGASGREPVPGLAAGAQHDLLRQLISPGRSAKGHHSPAESIPPVEGAAEEAVALRLDRDGRMLLA